MEELGGPATPAVGFALGLERVAMLLPEIEAAHPDIGVVAIGNTVHDYALNVAKQLREAGCSVVHCGGGNAKRQFKMADREHTRFVAVVGEDEMAAGKLTLKNMADGGQQTLNLNQAIAACLNGSG